MKYSISLFALFIVLIGSEVQAQTSEPKVNQLGYLPGEAKIAITPKTSSGSFAIKDAESGEIKYSGSLTDGGTNEPSGEEVQIADFSQFDEPGSYILEINGREDSYEFEIKGEVYNEVTDAVLKAYYYMRASIPLDEQYAGKWARPEGHPDLDVMVHPSAINEARPEGTIIASPKGWYDAGDYNKYVVNSGISTYTLLFAYEQFPDFFAKQNLNIPESNNSIPDILDESLWNLRWLLTMQDPTDGGVYHKVTTANFEDALMPEDAVNQRYVVMKNTPATLDFAAMMAQASRVYRPFLLSFADSALDAAKYAWNWAQKNDNTLYRQFQMNNQYDPDVVTGAYGDWNISDERFWAGVELFITTKDRSFYDETGWKEGNITIPSWNNVRALGLYSLIHHRNTLDGISSADKKLMADKLVEMINELVDRSVSAPYRSPFGLENQHFFWGSNGHAGNMGMAILQAYQLTNDPKYYKGALHIADYLLGLNPTGYSYITGYGDKPIMNIHHRPSQADGITDPVPGLVSGGPNPGNMSQDCGEDKYPSKLPALAFLDDWCSYSTNEITINWNAPVVYLLSGLKYLKP